MSLALNGSLITIFLIFWVTFLLLKKLYFDPYRRVIEEREKYLRERQERESRALSTWEEKINIIKQELERARRESLEEVDKIKKEAEKARQEKIALLKEALAKEERAFMERMDRELEEAKRLLGEKVKWIAEEIEKKLLSW